MELRSLKHLLVLGQVLLLKVLMVLREQTLVGEYLLKERNSQVELTFQVQVH